MIQGPLIFTLYKEPIQSLEKKEEEPYCYSAEFIPDFTHSSIFQRLLSFDTEAQLI